MDETSSDPTQHTDNAPLSGSVAEVRYSLREMMQAVQEERRDSALGRELVDATEIEQMFSTRIQKKKRS